MSKIELVKKVLNVNVYGREVVLNFPNRAQSKKLRVSLASDNPNHDEIFEDLICELGMPKELIDEISDFDLLEIIKSLQPTEKKS